VAKKLDWLYHRKNCVTCQRARAFLETHGIGWKDETNAAKEKRAPDEALELARSSARVVVLRGKKIVTFDMKKEPPDDDTLLAHLIGPSGNLRAPTVRIGQTLLVGFSDEAYRDVLKL
jgi:arsenate reductase-like glutaredoxin family protein